MKPEAKKMLERAHSLENEAQTKELYRDWASTYDDTMIEGLGYLSPTKAARLLADFVANPDDEILDVGVGTGLVGKELAAFGFTNIDGLDYSEQMLAAARKKGHYRRLFEADLNDNLELESENYEGMICIGTFTHGHVKADCLDELFRLLKPRGKFVTAIRKDYWQSAGFKQKAQQLCDAGIIRTLISREDSNYADSKEAESWFLVWEKI